MAKKSDPKSIKVIVKTIWDPMSDDIAMLKLLAYSFKVRNLATIDFDKLDAHFKAYRYYMSLDPKLKGKIDKVALETNVSATSFESFMSAYKLERNTKVSDISRAMKFIKKHPSISLLSVAKRFNIDINSIYMAKNKAGVSVSLESYKNKKENKIDINGDSICLLYQDYIINLKK